LRGAGKLFGERTPKELNELANLTARHVKVSFDIFEDALCGWQKHRGKNAIN
jgi:hypothetical protein